MENIEYIGKTINIQIDRAIGERHPNYPNLIYLTNYGYIPETVAADGEPIDCYLLGVFQKVDQYTGKCIALIHRLNDNEDKLIIVPEGKEYTNEQIQALTEYQEQYFDIEIKR